MNKYLIRFDTKHAGTDHVWKIFENDKLHLVKAFFIKVFIQSESTIENGSRNGMLLVKVI